MDSPGAESRDWKARLRHELIEYGINVLYLTLAFAAFTEYRRLLLAAHDISYTEYGVALIEALILGKVIMIGGVFHFGRGLEKRSLIYPALYKTFVFSLFVSAFKFMEYLITKLWNGEALTGSLVELYREGFHEELAYVLVVFVALLPFFMFKEMGRVLGRKEIWTLFFNRRADP